MSATSVLQPPRTKPSRRCAEPKAANAVLANKPATAAPIAATKRRAATVGSTGNGGSVELRARRQARVGQTRLRAVPFAALICVLLGAGLVSLLLINTALAQDAFVIQKLQTEQARNYERENELAKQLSLLNAPQNLSKAAEQLGQVPATAAPCFVKPNQTWSCPATSGSNSKGSKTSSAPTVNSVDPATDTSTARSAVDASRP